MEKKVGEDVEMSQLAWFCCEFALSVGMLTLSGWACVSLNEE